jgi:hypothetical protein
MSKIKFDFPRLSDANLEISAQAIVLAMTGNANFTTPSPTLTVVNAAITPYSLALSAAQTRDKNKIAEKNDARVALQDVLILLGNYVTLTAEGDRTILLSSGFPLVKERVPAPDITKPENIEVANGINSGEANVSVTAVPYAKSYVHQFTSDPLTAASNWSSTPTTRCKHTYNDLAPGQKLWFRVAAVGCKGQLAYSDPLSKIVQ